jgi:hypothetical protein
MAGKGTFSFNYPTLHDLLFLPGTNFLCLLPKNQNIKKMSLDNKKNGSNGVSRYFMEWLNRFPL